MEERINSVIRSWVNEIVKNSLAKTRISPNALTIIGVFASFAACLITVKFGLFFGALAILLSSLFDTLDGAVAKTKNQTTNFGAFLDDISDRFGEMFYFGAIFWLEGNFTAFLAAVTSVLVSYFNASAKARGFKISLGKVTGRPGRIILLFILMLISPWWPISQTLWTLIVLNIFTLVKRGIEVRKQSV